MEDSAGIPMKDTPSPSSDTPLINSGSRDQHHSSDFKVDARVDVMCTVLCHGAMSGMVMSQWGGHGAMSGVVTVH